ncbi:MAG: hypothetical protein V8Q27_02680 [Eubacteriales bacterium]
MEFYFTYPCHGSRFYPDGTLRNFTIGMQSAWAGSGGFVFNILSGHLANSRIQNIYLVYFLCIAFTLIVCLILPEAPFASSSPEKRSSIPGFSLLIGFITFLFSGCANDSDAEYFRSCLVIFSGWNC